MSQEMDELVAQIENIKSGAELEDWRQSHELSSDLLRSIWTRSQDLLTVDPRVSLRLSEWMIALALHLNEPFTKALALRAKGNALVSVNDCVQGVEYFDESLKIFREIGDDSEIARTMMNRVLAYVRLSRFGEALSDSNHVTEMFVKLRDQRGLGRHLINVANIYFRLDRFLEELEILERAEEILSRLDDSESLCYIHVNRAVVLTSLNRADEALKEYELAGRIATENDMPLLVSQCDYNICYLYFLQGQYTKALEMLNVVRKHMKERGDRWHSALCNLDQSEIYLELNMHQDAIELAKQAYDGFESIGMTYEMAKALAFMGIAHNHLHNYGKALELFDSSRAMFKEQGNNVWLSLVDLYQGIVYFQTGRYYEALDLARKAYEFFSKSGLKTKRLYAQLLVARVHLQLGNLNQALTEAESCLRQQGETPAPWLNYQIQFVLGDILAHRGETDNARSAFRKAVEELEILRTNIHVDELRMTFLKDKLKIYEALVRSGLQLGDAESLREAFEAVEHSKSRTLVDLLANNVSSVHPNRESDSELGEYLRTIREELNWYYTRINIEERKTPNASGGALRTLIEEVQSRENQLVKLLRQVSVEPSGYVTLQRVITSSLEEIQQTIPDDTVLIEFYIVGDEVIAFAVSREQFRVFPDLVSEPVLRTSFELLRFQLTKFNLGAPYVEKFGRRLLAATKEHLHELYQELIAPIENALHGRRAIVFVPHGFMHYIPFHALFDGDRYLIDDYEISYAPSATIYRSCFATDSRPTTDPLVIGVPDVRAPQILDEVRGIASVFKNAQVLVGPEATEERLRELSTNASIIHIASHGSFRSDNPMFSSIQLGDTWLSLFDIYNLRTSAELVTLSGCGTGMSKVVGGDELIGLVRGFLYAGARSLVVSLWDIHDQTTATFMKNFYSHLAAGRNRWHSLRTAVIDLKENQSHPFYWAPFIGIGAP
jgi:tetratricopeptide (TPR) repeat protein